MKTVLLYCYILFLPISVLAQDDLTGTWEGTFYSGKKNNFYRVQSKIVLEIQQVKNNIVAMLTAYTIDTSQMATYLYFGKINKKADLLILKGTGNLINETDQRTIDFNLFCFLKEGQKSTKILGDCNTNTSGGQFAEFEVVKVSKEQNMPKEIYNEFIKKYGDKNSNPIYSSSLLIEDRHEFIIDTIEIKNSSISFQIFDNGYFDEDIVRVSFNNIVYIDDLLLNKKHKPYDLVLEESKLNCLKIISLKEGSIPNTDVLLNIFDNGIKRQYRFNVNGLTNANIYFKATH